MRIALLGARGIPANYGGFETFSEELAVRLAKRGHQVTVYCRTNNVRTRAPEYRGVRLVHLPTIPQKYLDTPAHTALATLHFLFRRADVALYMNAANALFTLAPRITGIPVALNVDGLERERKKWNAVAKTWYRISERLSTWFPNEIVTDAQVIEDYYGKRYGKSSTMIAYGADLGRVETRAVLDRLGLEPGEYFLYVSRMEPENNALLTVQAFERAAAPHKLVMVGDAPYAAEYIRRVRSSSDPRILFPGAIYGDGYRELQSHCRAYIHATEVGGTHPALIEAMGRGAPVLYLDTPENREVAGQCGVAFEKDTASLAGVIDRVDSMDSSERRGLGERASAIAAERYDWERVCDRYEELFETMVRG